MCYTVIMKNTQFLRSTKIVATLGPSSNTENKIKKLIFAGVNVFRLNFSHGSHKDHLSTIDIIRRLETNLKFQLGILADHAPLLTALDIGVMRLKLETGWTSIVIMEGFAEVEDNKVTIFKTKDGPAVDVVQAFGRATSREQPLGTKKHNRGHP